MSAQAHGLPGTAVPPLLQLKRVALFAATSWEVQAVLAASDCVERTRVAGHAAAMFSCGRFWCYVIQTGIGPDRANRVAGDVLDDASWDAVISTGFAGSLRGAAVGGVMIGTSVMALGGCRGGAPLRTSLRCDPTLVRLASAQLPPDERRLAYGPFISTDHVVGSADEKGALASLYVEAVGLDMESAAVAAAARRRGAPFVIIRAVSDRVQDSLPMDFNVFLHARRQVGAVAREVARCLVTPSCWTGLIHLGQHSRQAATQLTDFFRRFLFSTLVAGYGMDRAAS